MNEHMWVLDIQNKDNNTTRTAFRIGDIMQIFRDAYSTMYAELQRFQPGREFDVISKLLY